jgi:hypothetical protein
MLTRDPDALPLLLVFGNYSADRQTARPPIRPSVIQLSAARSASASSIREPVPYSTTYRLTLSNRHRAHGRGVEITIQTQPQGPGRDVLGAWSAASSLSRKLCAINAVRRRGVAEGVGGRAGHEHGAGHRRSPTIAGNGLTHGYYRYY